MTLYYIDGLTRVHVINGPVFGLLKTQLVQEYFWNNFSQTDKFGSNNVPLILIIFPKSRLFNFQNYTTGSGSGDTGNILGFKCGSDALDVQYKHDSSAVR